MWDLLDLLELADLFRAPGELAAKVARETAVADGNAFDDREPHPGPPVPEPPPPRLPDTGWDHFAPEAKDF